MQPGMRESGIEVLGPVPWGTHFCLFYKTKQDLIDVLVPYFKAGLENNEYCMCITSKPFDHDEVRARMSEALPDFDKCIARGQIEIIPYDNWYVIDGVFDSQRVLAGWVEKLQDALARGFSGLRLSGNTFWLEKAGWKDFLDYEEDVNDTIGQYSIMALCTYSLDRCNAEDILDVVSTHRFALSKRENRWKIIESQEQKEARRALRESEIRFRSLIQNSSDIIRILDKDCHIIYDSPSSGRILGYPADSLLGKSPLDYIHPDDRELVRTSLDGVRHKTNSGKPTEFRIRKADGKYLYVESIGVNMIGVPGVDGIVITTRPITERKQAEEELKTAKAQAELYLDLMGHDINNMHQIALGYLELARELKADEAGNEFIDKPMEVLQRSTRLIRNVRKLQQLREGILPIDCVDVCAVLEDVRREFGSVPDRDITLNTNGCKHCHVLANELLHDVFANLVSNAIKHTGGRAKIVISLDTMAENGNGNCRVTVEDNGPGIPDNFKARIFNRMLKGTDKAKGMGLGLYLVKSVVDSYGGRVWAEDRVHGDHTKGAKFVVLLPAATMTGE
jgi:PAS domain S-box-containing protein